MCFLGSLAKSRKEGINLLKPTGYVTHQKFKKFPFFAHVVNSLSVQAALMLNKGIFVGNSNTTRKNKHP
jgi:hypothetical protein